METPYRTPRAVVDDSPLPARAPPPRQANWGVHLLWASFVLSFCSLLPAVDPEFFRVMQEFPWNLLLGIILSFCGLDAWLIWMCHQGKRWARTGLASLTLISLCLFLQDLVSVEHFNSLKSFLSTVTNLLDCAGLSLLFTPSSRKWFLETAT